MTDNEKLKLMQETVAPIFKLLESRLANNMDALEAITPLTLIPAEIPDFIQRMREEEAAKIRIVVKEQREVLSILKIMYPNG